VILEDISSGASVLGVLPHEAVLIVDTEWYGDDALKVMYETDEGASGSRLLFRADEGDLQLMPREDDRAEAMIYDSWAYASQAQKRPATPDDFRKLPMGVKAPLTYSASFSESEWERISFGYVPFVMEQKWFIYVHDETAFLHRSWTGFCLYQVRFEPRGGRWHVREAWVADDPEVYNRSDDAYEASVLDALIRNLLLDQDRPFPIHPDASDPGQAALSAWTMFGGDAFYGLGGPGAADPEGEDRAEIERRRKDER
jgi:hypothetical protein